MTEPPARGQVLKLYGVPTDTQQGLLGRAHRLSTFPRLQLTQPESSSVGHTGMTRCAWLS